MKKTNALILAMAAGLFFAGANSMDAQAASTIRAILPSAGVATILEDNVEKEEYLQVAEEVKAERKAMYGYENLGVAKVNDYLNIRETPSEGGELVGKLPKNGGCEVIKEENGWYQIKSGKVSGYVRADYLITGDEARYRAQEIAADMAVATSGGLRVREEPNTDCPVITMVAEGEELEVVEVLDGWVKIMLDDEEAYVSAEYVTISKNLEKAVTMTEIEYGEGITDVRVDLVNYAKQFLGNPYVWGGTSLTNGADCSGFVQSIFKQYGVSLPRTSVSQSQSGTKISLSEAKPGDLIFYDKGGAVNHVAIYIGNGQVIHASNPRTGIRISNATYRTPHSVRRVLP